MPDRKRNWWQMPGGWRWPSWGELGRWPGPGKVAGVSPRTRGIWEEKGLGQLFPELGKGIQPVRPGELGIGERMGILQAGEPSRKAPTEEPKATTRKMVQDTNTGIWIWRTFDQNGQPMFAFDEMVDPRMIPKEEEEEEPEAELPWLREERLARQRQAQQEFGLQEEMFAWQQQQAQQQFELQRQQQLAQLATNPISWLQYSALAGEQPAVQPWMRDLLPEQYSGLEAGAALPGWKPPEGYEQGALGMATLPELTRPGMQTWRRMGPAAQAQYKGYRRARTGAIPEETEHRIRATAPPRGHGGLRWLR